MKWKYLMKLYHLQRWDQLIVCLWFFFRASWQRRRSRRAEPLWRSELWVGALCTPGVESVCSASPCGKSSEFTAYVSAALCLFDAERPSHIRPCLPEPARARTQRSTVSSRVQRKYSKENSFKIWRIKF